MVLQGPGHLPVTATLPWVQLAHQQNAAAHWGRGAEPWDPHHLQPPALPGPEPPAGRRSRLAGGARGKPAIRLG